MTPAQEPALRDKQEETREIHIVSGKEHTSSKYWPPSTQRRERLAHVVLVVIWKGGSCLRLTPNPTPLLFPHSGRRTGEGGGRHGLRRRCGWLSPPPRPPPPLHRIGDVPEEMVGDTVCGRDSRSAARTAALLEENVAGGCSERAAGSWD